MKVTSTNNIKVAIDTDPNNGNAPVNQGVETGSVTDDNLDYLDAKFAIDETDATEAEAAEGDVAFLEFIAYYGTGPGTSSNDFATVNVPTVQSLRDTAGSIIINDEFCDRIEANYKNLESRIKEANKALKGKIPEDIYRRVIADREEAFIQIKEELENVAALREEIEIQYNMEMENLKTYGAEYYKWNLAYQNVGDYNGAIATLGNKPDPTAYNLDLNGDGIIGRETEDVCLKIATRQAENKDAEYQERVDVINTRDRSVINFNELGEIKDFAFGAEYQSVYSHNNLQLVDRSRWPEGLEELDCDYLLEMQNMAQVNLGNGFYNTPIDITIPEYVRINEDGIPIGLSNHGTQIIQEKGEGELKRIIKAELRTVRSTNTDTGSDYEITLHSDEGPVVTLRIRGLEGSGIAASERAISFNGGYEGDEFKRISGINIDAIGCDATPEFNINQADIIRKIEAKIGIRDIDEDGNISEYTTTPEQKEIYDKAINQLNQGRLGLLVSGFHSISGKLGDGNNIVLLSKPNYDLVERFTTGSDGKTIANPLSNRAIDMSGGYNALFEEMNDNKHDNRSTNTYANNVGLYWGGNKRDNIYLNVLTSGNYIHASNTHGSIEIGNKLDANDKLAWIDGEEHVANDAYILDVSEYKFANWYEKEVWKIAVEQDHKNIPPPPLDAEGYLDEAAINSLDYSTCSPASYDQIKTLLNEQIAAHEDALKNQSAEKYDESNFGEGIYTWDEGPAGEMQQEMNDFFGGWSACFDFQDKEIE